MHHPSRSQGAPAVSPRWVPTTPRPLVVGGRFERAAATPVEQPQRAHEPISIPEPRTPAPGGRDRFLDLVRAVALARVVFRHALQWKWLGYFASMPVMFFVAGSLFARSADRRPGVVVTYDRMRRLLVPYWVFAFVALTVLMAFAGPDMQSHGDLNVFAMLVPLATPVGATSGELESFTVHLWYLRAYIWLVLLGVLLYRLFKRSPVLATALSTVPILVYAFSDELGFEPPEISALMDLATYLPFWVLGYGCHRGWFDKLGARGCAAIAMGSLVIAAAYIRANPLPDNDPNSSNAVLFFLGVPLLFGVFALRAPLTRVAESGVVRPVVDWISARALTIYLWHLVALAMVAGIANEAGWDLTPGREDLLLGLTVVPLTLVFVLALGWLEDVAARRPPRLWPGASRPRTEVHAAA